MTARTLLQEIADSIEPSPSSARDLLREAGRLATLWLEARRDQFPPDHPEHVRARTAADSLASGVSDTIELFDDWLRSSIGRAPANGP